MINVRLRLAPAQYAKRLILLLANGCWLEGIFPLTARQLLHKACVVPVDGDLVNLTLVIKAENENMLTVEPQALGRNAQYFFFLFAENHDRTTYSIVGFQVVLRLHGVVQIRERVHQGFPDQLSGFVYFSPAVFAQGLEVHIARRAAQTQHPVDVKILIGRKELNAGAFLGQHINALGGFGGVTHNVSNWWVKMFLVNAGIPLINKVFRVALVFDISELVQHAVFNCYRELKRFALCGCIPTEVLDRFSVRLPR